MPADKVLPDDWSETLAQMAGVLLTEETLSDLLELVVSLAQSTLDRADGVGISLTDNGKVRTAAYSDGFVKEVDIHQYEAKAGPCLHALETSVEVHVPDLATDNRWPVFRDRALEHGVAAVLSLPLAVSDGTHGALNVYSFQVGPWAEVQRRTLQMFADQASILLVNAQAFAEAAEKTNQLQEALRSREVIGIAKGILMEREAVTDEEAFDMLRRVSQNTNTKLRDVAQQIVDHAGKH